MCTLIKENKQNSSDNNLMSTHLYKAEKVVPTCKKLYFEKVLFCHIFNEVCIFLFLNDWTL